MDAKDDVEKDAAQKTWFEEQITKSEFFHQKLHQWGLLTIADVIENVKGEDLLWDHASLGISPRAWDKVIHRGVKPVTVFAHPDVLIQIPRAVSYYRMLAMVSQKSMSGVRLRIESYETGQKQPNRRMAQQIAVHLNKIISRLIEGDEQLDEREFDLWRGMAAGAQAQGSWVNDKGRRVQETISGLVQKRLLQKGHVRDDNPDWKSVELVDGRKFVFKDDPDIEVHKGERITAAVEIKGGTDPAGVLERMGAAVKSLARIREANPKATTILIIHGSVMTQTAIRDLDINRDVVTDWITIEDILTKQEALENLFELLEI